MGAHQNEQPLLTIGALARQLGIHPRALRYYERIGLLAPSSRTAAGYRLYSERDAERVAFIRHAQTFGLSLHDIAGILSVRDSGSAPCHHVRALAEAHLREFDVRLTELLRLRAELAYLAEHAKEVEAACQMSDDICLAFESGASATA